MARYDPLPDLLPPMTAEDLYAFRFLADAQLSPDGEHVAFTVRTVTPERDGYASGVWLVPFDGSREAVRFTSGAGQDAQPRWSPDGRTLAFLSDRAAPEKSDGKKRKPKNVFVLSLDGGEARQLTSFEDDCGDLAWSPDGRRIAFAVKDAKLSEADEDGLRVYERMRYKTDEGFLSDQRRKHVWIIEVTGGEPRRLTEGDWDDLQPAWSPDGREIAFISNRSADRARIIFVGSDQGTANVYSVPASGGEVVAETLGSHQVVSLSLASDARRFACVFSHATCPGDVAAGELGKGFRCLTDLNGELLRTRHITPPERVEFRGADGWMVEGWLMKPRGFDPAKKWPLVLEIHGGPHSTYGNGFFHEFQVLTGRGYGVLYTNPRGSHAYGEKFSTACVGDWGGKDYEDLMAGVDDALKSNWVDGKRLYVTGGSYGGFMTNWIVGHTTRFRAAATQRSISNNISAFGTSDIGWHFWEHEMGNATP